MTTEHLLVIESWKMSYGNEVIADLQHSSNGLMPGTLLKSTATDLKWKVLFRVIFIQVEHQKKFKGEQERILHLSFDAPKADNLERLQTKVKEQESQGIYQYVLEPIEHSNKPQIGDELVVAIQQTCG